jgi:hypothetical protein
VNSGRLRASRRATLRPYRRTAPRRRGGRFEFSARWRRTQRIRTAAAIPLQAVIVDDAELPVYMRISDKAKQLRELGMSYRAIARALGVSDKTIAKAAGAAGLSPGDVETQGSLVIERVPPPTQQRRPVEVRAGCPHPDGA